MTLLSAIAGTNFVNATNTAIFHNTHSGGTIGSVLFSAQRIDLTVGLFPCRVVIADIDGDGKKDIVVCNYNSNYTSGSVSVLRNLSTPGQIHSLQK